MNKLLIKGATIVTEDKRLGVIQRGDILVEGNKIKQIAPRIEDGEAQVLDVDGFIAIPGFVDAHRHNWESLIRGIGVDWTLAQYMTAVKKVLGPLYTADDTYLASYLGALECLDCGITTMFDWFHNINEPAFSDAAIAGMKDAGIRFVLGYANSVYGELPVSSIPMDYDDFRRVQKQYFSANDTMMSLSLAIRGPQFATLDLLHEEMKLARETGVFLSMNAGDGSWGKTRPIKKMEELGYLKGFDYTFIHCNTLADDELKLIGDIGASTVSCPEVELNMGHGFQPTLRLLKAGVKPALGVDVCTSVPGDMFGTMRFLLAGVRCVVNDEALKTDGVVDPLPLLASDALHFATQHGAYACKLGDHVGSLTVGKEADITLIDTNSLNMFPVNDPIGAVVEAAHPGNIDTVIVAGRIVKHHKKLVGVNTASLRGRIDAARDRLFARAGVPTTGEWVPERYEG